MPAAIDIKAQSSAVDLDVRLFRADGETQWQGYDETGGWWRVGPNGNGTYWLNAAGTFKPNAFSGPFWHNRNWQLDIPSLGGAVNVSVLDYSVRWDRADLILYPFVSGIISGVFIDMVLGTVSLVYWVTAGALRRRITA